MTGNLDPAVQPARQPHPIKLCHIEITGRSERDPARSLHPGARQRQTLDQRRRAQPDVGSQPARRVRRFAPAHFGDRQREPRQVRFHRQPPRFAFGQVQRDAALAFARHHAARQAQPEFVNRGLRQIDFAFDPGGRRIRFEFLQQRHVERQLSKQSDAADPHARRGGAHRKTGCCDQMAGHQHARFEIADPAIHGERDIVQPNGALQRQLDGAADTRAALAQSDRLTGFFQKMERRLVQDRKRCGQR